MDSEKQDNEKQDFALNSGTFLDSAFFSPETVLPASYLLDTSESEEIKLETPKVSRRIEIEEPPRRSSHWVGLIASVSVGMVIAFFLFPMIALVKRSTQSYVTDSWESEINRRVGNYEQIHANQGNTLQNADLLPYNLAASGWQEMISSLPLPYPSNLMPLQGNPYQQQWNYDANVACSVSNEWSTICSPSGCYNWDMLPLLDISGMADTMLLVTPNQYHAVRSAFGQNILLRDGRVFFRTLPGVE